jgi:hypothetical protein
MLKLNQAEGDRTCPMQQVVVSTGTLARFFFEYWISCTEFKIQWLDGSRNVLIYSWSHIQIFRNSHKRFELIRKKVTRSCCMWKCECFYILFRPDFACTVCDLSTSLICFSYGSMVGLLGSSSFICTVSGGGNSNSPAEIFDSYNLEQKWGMCVCERQIKHISRAVKRFSYQVRSLCLLFGVGELSLDFIYE